MGNGRVSDVIAQENGQNFDTLKESFPRIANRLTSKGEGENPGWAI